MSIPNDNRPSGKVSEAFYWTLFLSIAFCWIVILGQFMAGFMGGRKARTAGKAIAAAIGPAILWAVVFVLVSNMSLPNKGHILGPLFYLAPVSALALLGGALVGCASGKARLLGVVVTAAGLIWFLPLARDVQNVYQMIKPVKTENASAEQLNQCNVRLTKLYNAMMLYTSDWDDTLPPAGRWQTALADPTESKATAEEMRCPSESRNGYAMNSAVSAKRVSEIIDKAHTPLLYDSADLNENANDAVTSMPIPGRHQGKNYIIYMDGHIDQK